MPNKQTPPSGNGYGDSFEKFVMGLREGRPLRFEKLTIVPLSGAEVGPSVVLLGRAIGSNLAEVGEIGEHGDVPRLRVTNRGRRAILNPGSLLRPEVAGDHVDASGTWGILDLEARSFTVRRVVSGETVLEVEW